MAFCFLKKKIKQLENTSKLQSNQITISCLQRHIYHLIKITRILRTTHEKATLHIIFHRCNSDDFSYDHWSEGQTCTDIDCTHKSINHMIEHIYDYGEIEIILRYMTLNEQSTQYLIKHGLENLSRTLSLDVKYIKYIPYYGKNIRISIKIEKNPLN